MCCFYLQYGVVLDAGSSHTKLFVYRWDGSKINGTAVAHQIYAVGCQPQGRMQLYN